MGSKHMVIFSKQGVAKPINLLGNLGQQGMTKPNNPLGIFGNHGSLNSVSGKLLNP